MNFNEIRNSILGLENVDDANIEKVDELALDREWEDTMTEMQKTSQEAAFANVDAMRANLAAREVALESNEGMDPTNIYAQFGFENVGMEAVKDVAARHAYSAIAGIKGLINTVISWLKNLLGVSVSSKKIFTSLKKKASDQNKALAKLSGKVSDKLKRTFPDYGAAFEKLANIIVTDIPEKYGTGANSASGGAILTEFKDGEKSKFDNAVTKLTKSLEAMKTEVENMKEIYDKDDSDEVEGSACYNKIREHLKTIENNSSSSKSTNFEKQIKDVIKQLENLRKDFEKKDDVKAGTANWITPARNYLNKYIAYLTKLQDYQKQTLKEIIKVADDCLTTAKGIQATLTPMK